ncbi:MAG: hypothetical protein VXV96_16755 [Bdellovibrionota bacterium]|nr:hypothetical protein [Bdellovibrionota bacterium]
MNGNDNNADAGLVLIMTIGLYAFLESKGIYLEEVFKKVGIFFLILIAVSAASFITFLIGRWFFMKIFKIKKKIEEFIEWKEKTTQELDSLDCRIANSMSCDVKWRK